MTLSTRRIAAVTAGAAVLLLIVWYLALFRPQSHHLATARAKYDAAEAQVVQLDTQIASLKAIVAHKAADQATLDKLNSEVPEVPDLTTALDQLHQLALSAGVQLTTVNPAAPSTSQPSASGSSSGSPANGGLQAVGLNMTATGTYQQLTAFFTDLTSMPRSLVINTVSISPGSAAGGPTVLTATLGTQIFYAPGSPQQ